jgi:predicted outer membrane repeat protein
MVGYVGYSRVLPAFANSTCVVNDAGLGAGTSTYKTFEYCITNSSAGDTITFDSSITQITMSDERFSSFTIDKSLIIDGYSGRTSRMIFDGDYNHQILAVTSGTLTLKDLSFRYGFATRGGAIYANDSSGDVNVFLQGVEARDNDSNSSGGFLHTDGDVTVSSSANFASSDFSSDTLSDNTYNGGAIYAKGNVFVQDASFQNYKSSGRGGVIYAGGIVALNYGSYGVIFSNNSSYTGGVIYANNVYVNAGQFYNSIAVGPGGAIYARGNVVITESSGIAQFRHSYSQNGNGGAIYADTVDFQSGTIDYSPALANSGPAGAVDGGGIFAKSAVSVSGGTFKGLEATRHGGAVASNGTVTISGSPKFEANDGGARGGAVYSSGDIQISGNPEFKNNNVYQYGGAVFSGGNVTVGGTASFTGNKATVHGGAIYAASTKKITINDTPVFTSNTGGTSGGALRAPEVEITGVSTFTSNVAGSSGGGAVYSSLVTVSGDATFTSNSSQYRGGAISHIGSSAMTISGDAKFYTNGKTNANSTSYVTQDGGAVYANGNITISGDVIFSGNYASNNGGAVQTRSHAYISGGGNLTNNEASNNGGAIYASNLTSTATTHSFVGNTAVKGGAIYVRYATSLTGNHTFTNNSASLYGGAVKSNDFTLTSTSGNESVFDNNDAATSGGAIYATNDLSVTYAEFKNSDAGSAYGGAIYAFGDATISNSTFTDNTAGSRGGALLVGNSFDIDDSTFTTNSSLTGGAVSMPMSFTESHLDNSTFTSNSATNGRGGAIHTTSSAVTITSATFDNNSADGSGGAVYGGQDVTITSSTFTANSSTSSSAGAVYSSNETNVTGSYFYNNQADRSGGAISSSSTITVNDSLFYSNTAGANYNGGGIYAKSVANVYNSTLYKNSAGSRGSAIFGDGSSGKSVLNFVTVYKNYITNYANNLDAAVYLGAGYTYNSIISGNVNYGTSTGLDFRASGTAHAYNTLFTADGTALGGNDDYVNNVYAFNNSYGGNIYFGSPRLFALADNGGPTKTLKPRFGSPAIDYAQTSFTQPDAGQPLRFDQRGQLRVYGGRADLGAVELQSVPTAAQFTITVTAGANGSISPSGNQTVNELSDNTFTVTPDAGYKIASVTVDGVSETVSDSSSFSYTFDDVEQNHSIAATFEPITHTISVTAGANGSISPSTTTVNQGSNQTFTVTPNSGYRIASVSVDGVDQTVSVSSSFSFSFVNITAAGTITASFEVDPDAATPSAPSIAPQPTVVISESTINVPGDEATAEVRNWSESAKIFIGGVEVEVIEVIDNEAKFVVPDIAAGTYPIVIESNLGRITNLVDFVVGETPIEASQAEFHGWTKRINDSQVKVYAKNPIGKGKIQFMFNGEEIAWVRAENEEEPKLRQAQGFYYLVRTVELTPEKQAIEIYLDGERVWRAAYTNK